MFCPSCASGTLAEFSAEILIHYSGLKNLDRPGVFVFPTVSICLNCGSSQFKIPSDELASLKATQSQAGLEAKAKAARA
jgi:hypothetical protein